MDQTDLLHSNEQSYFAELCLTLYERELLDLSWNGSDNALFLKRRLASLPYYVKRASHALLVLHKQYFVGQGWPLALDIQNASWQAEQSVKPPSAARQQLIYNWLTHHAALGLVVPVEDQQDKVHTVYLDSIDRIQLDKDKPAVHLNRFGWFDMNGQALDNQQAQLLKPGKNSMRAACCGHQWSGAGRRILPRTLSLREVLLAATLDWPTFKKARQLPTY